MKRFFLLVFLFFTFLGNFFIQTRAQSVWDGTADATWYNESQSYFEISTAEQLAGIAQLTQQGTTFNGKTIVLTSDIWLNADQDSTHNWIPIGGDDNSSTEGASIGNGFRGTFNGGGHSIYNMYCEKSNYFHAGLFGAIQNPSSIDSVVLINPVVKSKGMMGALVGFSKAGGNVAISNCLVINARIYGTGGNNIGGIIGATYPCAQSSSGITYITNCGVTGYISGNYIGGIAGNGSRAYTTNAYFAGTLAPTNSNWGGILGYCTSGELNISNVYSNLPSASTDPNGRDGNLLTDAYMQSSDFISDLGSAFMTDRGINNGYPILSYMCGISSTATEICVGESVTLTAQGYEYYSWSNGENTASITVFPTTTTTYTVTGTSISGATSTHSATITVHPQAIITATIMPSADGQIHGLVTPETSTVNCGSNDLVQLTVSPDDNYHISKVLVNGVQIYGDEFSEGPTYLTINPNGTLANVEIYLANTYNITTTLLLDDGTPLNNNSLVQPYGNNGITTVLAGDTILYAFNESARYHIYDITIDDASYGIIDTFTFEDIHEPHTIVATYQDACGITELPYSDDFETAELNLIPECYAQLNAGYLYTESYNSHSGNKCVYTYFYNPGHYYFILPRIIDTLTYPISSLEFSFWAAMSTASNSFTVGVMSNPADASTFTPINEIDVENTGYTQYITYFNQVDMSEVYGQYITIRINNTSSYSNYLYIDDIDIDFAPNCTEIRNLEISELYGSNVTITWDTNVVGGIGEYYIQLYDIANDYSLDYTTYDTTYTITGLSENTDYRIGVSVACPNSDYSDTVFIYFTTPCNTPIPITIAPNETESSSLPTNIYYKYSYTQQIIPAVALGGEAHDFSALAVQYQSSQAETRNIEIYLAHVPNNSTLANGWILPDANANIEFIQVFSGTTTFSNSEEGHWHEINLSTPFSYNGTDNILVIFNDLTGSYTGSRYFYCHTDSTTTNMARYTYRDASSYNPLNPSESGTLESMGRVNNLKFIYCDMSDCIRPNTLATTSIGESDAELTWISAGSESEWEVEYKTTTDTIWTSYGNVTGTPYLYLGGLSPDTRYQVRVRSVCSITEFSIWSEEITFRTQCSSITISETEPWFENFESYDIINGSVPVSPCWATPQTVTGYYGPSPFIYTGYEASAHSGVNTLEMKGSPTMIVLPEFTNDINTLRVSFWGNTTALSAMDAGTMTIGVISDVENPNSYVVVDTIPASAFNRIGTDAIHTDFFGPFDFLDVTPESGLRIALQLTNLNSSTTSWNLDDFTISLIPLCTSPVKNSVAITDLTARTATVSWVDNDETHNSWTLFYKPTTDSIWTSVLAGPNPSTTLTGLTPTTSYDVYVITNCAIQDAIPDATNTVTFSTTVSCPAPTNVAASSIATNTATISWAGSAQSYTIEYGETGFVLGNGTIVTSSTNSINLVGLNPNSHYTVFVNADCGVEDGISTTATTSFWTACDVVSIFPYTESFEYNLNCWTNTNITGSANWTTYNSYYGNAPIPDGLNFAECKASGYGQIAQLASPIFDLTSLSSPYIKFSHIQTAWAGDQDELHIFYKANPTDSLTLLTSFTNEISSWQVDSLALPNPSNQYQIIFEAQLHYGYGIGLDKVIVYEHTSTSIIEPTIVTHNAINITHNTATLKGQITDLGNQTITAQGFEWKETNGGTYTTVNATGSTMLHNLNNLNANTSYTYRAFVTTTNTTTYGDEVTFTTLQEPAIPCDVPTNIQVTTTETSATVTWESPADTWVLEYKAVSDMNWTLLLALENPTYNIINLTPNTTYEVHVKAICGDGIESAWSADIPFSTTSTPINTYTITATATGPGTIAPNGTLTVNEGENVTFTFSANTGASVSRLLVDDAETAIPENNEYTFSNIVANHTIAVEFEEETNIDELTIEDAVALYPNPATSQIQIKLADSRFLGAEMQIFDVYGKLISNSTIQNLSNQVNISQLANGMYLVRINTNDGMVTKRFVKR